jgi:hypothetical protein
MSIRNYKNMLAKFQYGNAKKMSALISCNEKNFQLKADSSILGEGIYHISRGTGKAAMTKKFEKCIMM